MVGQQLRKCYFVKIACFLLVALTVLACKKKGEPASTEYEPIKVLSYNIYEGFRGDETTITNFKKWADTLKADVIAFQEMKYFTKASLKTFAAEMGYPYTVMFHESGLPLALVSRHPITNIKSVPSDLHLIEAQILGYHFFVVHLNAATYEKRQQEMSIIMDRVNKISDKEKILMMGDFNNMSPQDAKDYDNTAKMNLVAQSEINNPGTKILNNGKIDYTVIQTLLDNGFYDTWKMFRTGYEKSAPTKLRTHNNYTRIDYIFVNKTLSNDYTKAYMVKDDFTDYASDHYPMVFIYKKR
ncbi:Endonuclease/Exonuclease/phosphatase family protein [compost metagenome]